MNPKVSVIVPAYNVEQTITACLNSLLLQTYNNKEIIVVNDGSTDNTAEICNKFKELNECIKVVHQKNAGVSSARNRALEIATGEYIVFVDSDDTVEPSYIEELMKWNNYDFVTAGYYWQKADMSWEERRFEDIAASKQTVRAFPSKFIGKYYFGSPWATLMKKKIIDLYELRFNEMIQCGEDILFIFQYLQHVETIKVLPVCGYKYCYYSGSLVNTRHKDFWKWKICVESEIANYFQPCNREEKKVLLNRKFDVLRDLLRDYSNQMSNQELYMLYSHPFFENAIENKKSNGTLKDRILIFAMKNKNYKIYVKMDEICFFFKRVKNKLKRTVIKSKE